MTIIFVQAVGDGKLPEEPPSSARVSEVPGIVMGDRDFEVVEDIGKETFFLADAVAVEADGVSASGLKI